MKLSRSSWSGIPPILIAAIISVAIVPLGELILHIAAGHATEWPLVLTCTSLVILAMILYMLLYIAQKLEAILDRGNIDVQFLPCDTSESAESAYDTVRRAIENAPDGDGTRVMVLNSFLEAIHEPSELANSARIRYYEALLKKSISYTRILQTTDTGRIDLAKTIREGYSQHYQRMIDRIGGSDRIDARLAPAIYPFSFVLMDVEHGPSKLFWQIDQYTSDKEGAVVFKVYGYIAITDPNRVITRHFYRFFETVQRARGTRVLDRQDLVAGGHRVS